MVIEHFSNTYFYIILFAGHDTGPGESGKKYRPLFLDHFDKKEAESVVRTLKCHLKKSP